MKIKSLMVTKAVLVALVSMGFLNSVQASDKALNPLQGKWKSLTDKGLVLKVKGNQWSTFDAKGKPVLSETVQYQAKCESGEQTKPCLAISGQFDISYYQIIKLTKKELTIKEAETIQKFKKM